MMKDGEQQKDWLTRNDKITTNIVRLLKGHVGNTRGIGPLGWI
jgi:hypothetical protein